jgi:hypothetical protein
VAKVRCPDDCAFPIKGLLLLPKLLLPKVAPLLLLSPWVVLDGMNPEELVLVKNGAFGLLLVITLAEDPNMVVPELLGAGPEEAIP